MKNNNSFIVVGGVFILCIFSFVTAKNILPENNNNQYYAKPNENMTAKIDKISVSNNRLVVDFSGFPTHYCLKTTKSTPSLNSLCWNKIDNNRIETSYFEYKKYYIWIKDKENKISERVVINKEF